jgi:2-phosphoglycolate phosphatase
MIQTSSTHPPRAKTKTRTQAVLFDLDGTLLDTAPDFVAVLNSLLAKHGRKQLPFATIREQVSEGDRALVSLGFTIEPSHPQFNALHQQLLHDYQAQLSRYSTLFDGMDEVLQEIESHDLQWGIVTNKPSIYTEAILADLLLSDRCAVTICPDHVTHRKPHPEPIHLACSRLDCHANEAIYVGDHRRDIEAGNHAESLTLAATWGYASAEDPPHQWGATAVIDKPADILRFIQR